MYKNQAIFGKKVIDRVKKNANDKLFLLTHLVLAQRKKCFDKPSYMYVD